MITAALLTYALRTAKEAFDLILSIGAGTGLIYLLRWFWWRVSAWSEIAAMTSSFLVAVGFFIARKNGAQIPDHISLIATVATTTVVWVSVTLLGPQTRRETLKALTRVVPERRPSSKRQAGRIRRAASAERSGDNRPPWLLRFCAEPPEGAGPAKTMPGGEIALHSPSGCAPAAAEAPPYLSTCRLTGGDV